MASSVKSRLVPGRDWLARPAATPEAPAVRYIFGLTCLGALLRLFALTGQSLWVDEILTWQALRPDLPFTLWEQFRDTIQGPLYLATVWPLARMFDPELMLRLPAAVAGVLAIPVFGRLAFQLTEGRAARAALLLFTLNPFLVWYSQEGRGYSFLVLFSLLTAQAYWALARGDTRRRTVIGFGLAAAAMMLSNLSGVFLLVAMGVSRLLFARPRTRSERLAWFSALGLAALLVGPWLLRASGIWAVDRILPGAGTGSALRGVTTFSPWSLPYAFFTFFFGYSLGPSLRELHQPDRVAVLAAYWPVLVTGGASAGVAALAGLFRTGRRQGVLILWILIPLALGTVLALRNVKPWNARYVVVALPWILMLAAVGLARLQRRVGAVVVLLLVGMTLAALSGHFGNSDYAKADVRAAAAWVRSHRTAQSVVLVPVVTGVFEFYDDGRNRLLDSYGRAPLADSAAADAYLDDVLAGVDRCTVVLARDWHFDPEGFLLPALALRGELVAISELPGVELFDWQGRRSPAVREKAGDPHGL